MIINFEKFNESYLNGGRQPLFHHTYRLEKILETDMLKTSLSADKEKSISFTRSNYFTESSNIARLVLDADKLKDDGYNIYPYYEVGNFLSKNKDKNPKKLLNKYKFYTKNNPNLKFRKIVGNTKHIGDSGYELEHEYEERCYESITDLGKYIIAIDIDMNYFEVYISHIKKYLKKYPHIKIYEFDTKRRWDRSKEISIFNKEKLPN